MTADIFQFDALAQILTPVIFGLGAVVLVFSRRYMQGEPHIKSYYTQLILLIASAIALACADHFAAFAISWGVSAYLLAGLIGHYKNWPQARAAKRRTILTLGSGTLCLSTAFALINADTGITTLSSLPERINEMHPAIVGFSGLLLIAAAMLQCACMPFHRWLTGSMPAPTPVSALMHAGIVNAGGLLIVRTHFLFSTYPALLVALLTLTGFAALIAGLCMRVRSDVKGQLAFSTSAQMSFMLVQCGLGLYSAAIAHLILHGMFKAYHFLAAGNALSHARQSADRPQVLTAGQGVAMLAGGATAIAMLALFSGKDFTSPDSQLVLLLFAALAGMQVMRSIFAINASITPARLLLSLTLISVAAGHYALIYSWLNTALAINTPQPLSIIHGVLGGLFIIAWLTSNFARNKHMPGLYMRLLNAGRITITEN